MKAPNNDVTIAPNFQLRLQYFLNWCLTLHYYQFPLLPKRIIQIISLPNSQALFDGTNSIAKKRHGVTKQEIWLQHRVSAIGWLFTLGWPPFSSISSQIRVGQGQGLCFFPTCSIAHVSRMPQAPLPNRSRLLPAFFGSTSMWKGFIRWTKCIENEFILGEVLIVGFTITHKSST